MGLIGCIRATTVAIDRPIYECPEIWVSPEFIDWCAGWSWRLDMPNPVEDKTPWKLGLDVFIGHHFVYTSAKTRAVWRITEVDRSRTMLLGRWPD